MSKKIHQHLLKVSNKHCPALETIIRQNGIINIDIPKNLNIFDCLAQTVVEQQLSYKAAKSIWGKIKNTAARLNLSLIDYFDVLNIELIRDNGLSKNKIKAILGAKKEIQSGALTFKIISNMDYPLYKKTITQLWGFGDWSAEMIAIFYLGKTNIWSEKDLILNRGIHELCDKSEINPEKLLALMDPYQSYLALHLWKDKD